jgi:hypothetical protein
MINLKPLKSESGKFQEPIRSIVELQKDAMPEQEFVEFFLILRKKTREIDNQKEVIQK